MKRFGLFLAASFLALSMTASAQIKKQRAMNWCWASAVQSVMAQAGNYQSQPQIAATLDGWPMDRPAYVGELVALLRHNGFRAWQAGRPGSPQELYNSLLSGWKLIAFVRPSAGPVGHYIVLQGVDPYSGAIIVSDPYTGATYPSSPAELYLAWRWVDSVVVGAPLF